MIVHILKWILKDLCVWIFCLLVCMCTTRMQCQWKPEEGVEYPRTGVQMVLSQHVSSENQTLVPWKSSQFSKASLHPYQYIYK